MMPSSFFPPSFMYQMQSPIVQNHPLLPTINPQDLREVEGIMLGKRSSMSFEEMGGEDELSDDCSQAGEKKRRLNIEQVRTLEKSFEIGKKLEPERKMQLARALGLQPRQIAIWFQNRRARWKTKKMEKDYEALMRQFDCAKAENDALIEQNNKLQAELLALKGGRETIREATVLINLNKETEGSSSSSDINIDVSRLPPQSQPNDDHDQSPVHDHHHHHHHHHHNQGIAFFPSYKQQSMMNQNQNQNQQQLLHGSSNTSSRPAADQIQHHEENFCNIFGGIEDPASGLMWAWPEQQNFQ